MVPPFAMDWSLAAETTVGVVFVMVTSNVVDTPLSESDAVMVIV